MGLGGLGAGDLMKMVSQMGKIKENMATLQDKMKKHVVDGEAGGGMVRVRMNGAFEILEVKIESDALEDPEVLGPLIVAASNAALRKVKEILQSEVGEAMGGVNLPPGFLGV